MKNAACKFASLALVCALAVFAQAQSRVTFNVPFNFVMADKTFPAGQYSMSFERERLAVRDSTGKIIFLAITNAVSGRRVSPTGELIFHCYESRCFLSEFWIPTRESGRQLLPSHYERELAMHWQRTEFALLQQQR
jgi:hypothetical protein